MAESKGLGPRTVLFRHGLRPSSFSLLTLFGIVTARLVGGSVVVETIFSLPGLGQLLYQSIGYRDFTMVQGVVAVVAVGYVCRQLDRGRGSTGFIDPRVRVDAAGDDLAVHGGGRDPERAGNGDANVATAISADDTPIGRQ